MKSRRRIGAALLLLATVAGLLVGTSASAGPGAVPLARTRGDGVLVRDIEIPVRGQQAIRAYLVRPAHQARPRSLAGTLYLHWFEPPSSHQNRSEFLAEATDLAALGMVALLPDLTFPWHGDPVGDERDVAAVEAQVAAVAKAYRVLVAQPGVDPARTAIVGHDYGAMYGTIVAQRERVRAEVFMAGDATWANWFDTYWLDLPPERKPAYRAQFAHLDPVGHVSRLGNRLYYQWAGRDQFVPAEVRAAFSAANPTAKVSFYETARHELHQPAKEERMAWLADQLGLTR